MKRRAMSVSRAVAPIIVALAPRSAGADGPADLAAQARGGALAAVASDTPAEPKPATVRLVVDGEAGVLLERRQNVTEAWMASVPSPAYTWSETWEIACVAPCEATVDAGSMYRVNGGGVTTSRDFTLPPGRNPLRLHLVPRSAFLHGTGIFLTVLGAVTVGLGVLGIVDAPSLADTSAASLVRGLGYTGIGAGIAMLVAGVPMWLLTYSVARTGDGQTLGSASPALRF
jgi:hypothetical protein